MWEVVQCICVCVNSRVVLFGLWSGVIDGLMNDKIVWCGMV